MRFRRTVLLALGSMSLVVAALAACVGDDPANAVVVVAEAGTPEGGSSPDGATATDAGGDDAHADADVGPVTKDPSTLAGLAFWYRADKDVSADAGVVLTWKDQSDGGRDAVSTTAPPKLKLNAFPNALPSIEFPTNVNGNGGAVLAIVGPGLTIGTNDYVVESVVKTNVTANGNAISLNAAVRVWLGRPGDGLTLDHNGNSVLDAPTKVTGGDWHVIGARRKGQTVQLRVDGAIVATTTGPDGGAPLTAGPDNIGANLYPLTGDIAELLMVIGATSDADVDAVEAQLKKRYGL
jgi:hypothetical protein